MSGQFKATDRRYDDLLAYIHDKGYTIPKVAKWIGMTRVGLGYKFRNAVPFTVGQSLIIKERLGMSWEDYVRFFGNKEDIEGE